MCLERATNEAETVPVPYPNTESRGHVFAWFELDEVKRCAPAEGCWRQCNLIRTVTFI